MRKFLAIALVFLSIAAQAQENKFIMQVQNNGQVAGTFPAFTILNFTGGSPCSVTGISINCIAGLTDISEGSGTITFLNPNGVVASQYVTNGTGPGEFDSTCATYTTPPPSTATGMAAPASGCLGYVIRIPVGLGTIGNAVIITGQDIYGPIWGYGSTSASSGYIWPLILKGSSYPLVTGDFSSSSQAGTWFYITASTVATFTLPNPAPAAGSCVIISNTSAGTETISSNGLGVDGVTTAVTALTMSRYQGTQFCSNGTNYFSQGLNSRNSSAAGVSSVAGEGVLFSGTPQTGAAVLNLLTQNANCVVAGPSSGGAATPTCRPMAPADLPAGGPYITHIFGATTSLNWTSATNYYFSGVYSILPTSTALTGMIEPFCSKIYGLSVSMSAVPPTSTSWTFTVRDGTTPTDLSSTVTIVPATSTANASDTSDNPSWTPGDGMLVHATCTGAGCTLGMPQFTATVYCR